MQINIKTTNFELTAPLKEYLEAKLNSLGKLLPESENISIDVELARTTRHHKKGLVYYAEANIVMPSKKMLRVEIYSEDIRKAIDKLKDEAKEAIKKMHQVRFTRTKKQVQKLKSQRFTE